MKKTHNTVLKHATYGHVAFIKRQRTLFRSHEKRIKLVAKQEQCPLSASYRAFRFHLRHLKLPASARPVIKTTFSCPAAVSSAHTSDASRQRCNWRTSPTALPGDFLRLSADLPKAITFFRPQRAIARQFFHTLSYRRACRATGSSPQSACPAFFFNRTNRTRNSGVCRTALKSATLSKASTEASGVQPLHFSRKLQRPQHPAANSQDRLKPAPRMLKVYFCR